MQPQVRDLQSLIQQYSGSFDPQRQLIDQDLAGLDASGAAQQAGLAATQKKAFGQIEQQASDKGVFFSGFSPDAQAEYTAGTYLPELAKLQATIASGRSSLLGKRADLDSTARTSAISAQEGDRNALLTWQQQQEQRAFEAEQARLARDAQAAENSKNRAASSAASSVPTPAQFLVKSFAAYDPKTMQGYTEREVIPALMATYNIPKEQAAALAYSYRKSNYKE